MNNKTSIINNQCPKDKDLYCVGGDCLNCTIHPFSATELKLKEASGDE